MVDTTILDHIFKDESITEEYIDACDKLFLALKASGKEEESFLYQYAGIAFLDTPKKEWGTHLIEISYRIDRRNKRLGVFQ